MRSKALGFALGLSLVLTACASRPKDVLLPVADTVPSTSRVAMLVTTTRARSDIPGEMFTGERGMTPSFADITVSIPPASVRKVGEVAWPKKLPSNPATDFAVLKAEEVTERAARRSGCTPLSGRARTTASWSSSMASTTASRTPSIALRRSPTIRAPTALRFWSRGRPAAARWPMGTIAKAPTTRAMRSKRCSSTSLAIPK